MTPIDYLSFFSDSIIYLSLLLIPLHLWGKDKKMFFLYFLIVTINMLSVYFLKILISAPRPTSSLIPLPPTPSFPSMHASLGMIPAGFYFHNEKYRFVLILYGILIAYSRVLLGVHYVIDIIVGALIGFTLPIFLSYKKDFILRLFKLD